MHPGRREGERLGRQRPAAARGSWWIGGLGGAGEANGAAQIIIVEFVALVV